MSAEEILALLQLLARQQQIIKFLEAELAEAQVPRIKAAPSEDTNG